MACRVFALLSVLLIACGARCASATLSSSSSSLSSSSLSATSSASVPLKTSLRQRKGKGKGKCGPFPFDQCSFSDRFKYLSRKRWQVHHRIANGPPFDSWWSKFRVDVKPWNKLFLSISKKSRKQLGKNYAGAQVLSKNWYGYGCYQVRMKPASVPGYVIQPVSFLFFKIISYAMMIIDHRILLSLLHLTSLVLRTFCVCVYVCDVYRVISTFFIYTGEFDAAPGRPKKHNEIDLEFVYRSRLKRAVLQTNFFANNNGKNEELHFPKFTPHKGFHTYDIKFTSKMIEWYADGQLIRTARNKIPKMKDGPFKIFMNVWVAGPAAYSWAGKYRPGGRKAVTIYDSVRYIKGENCKIEDNF